MIKRLIQRTLGKMGYEVRRRTAEGERIVPPSEGWTDLVTFSAKTAPIRGMTTQESCKMLYALCHQQTLDGDVAEIGSWQGRSTAYLGQAVLDSGNGRIFAIDHFKGNVGKESRYVVDAEDLSDLEIGFRANMKRVGLDTTVRLYNMPAAEAAKQIDDRSLRFLFIDGDHSYEGVRADVETFWSKLKPGAIVVFDDHNPSFPGVVRLARELYQGLDAPRAFSYWNTFVVQLPTGKLPRQAPL